MNSTWKDFLATTGARWDNGLVADFGDRAGELAAAGTATIIAPLTHLGLIEVSGSDAPGFLHNQLTSDVKHLSPAAAQYSAWCSAKGRMLASFLLYRAGDGYRLQLSADLLPAIHKRLQMFILRSKVALADHSDDCVLLGLAGPQSSAAIAASGLPAPDKPLATQAFADGIVICLAPERYEIVIDRAAAPMLWEQLATRARPVGTPVWQWLDIQAAVPLITRRTSEEFVPQMANFEQLGGVSFHKGCYPGQEVIARTQYLGKVKRHLYRVHSASAIDIGHAIYSTDNPDRPCGMIANAAPAPAGGYDALAVMQENFAVAGKLALAAPDGPGLELVAND
jgi:folate-binding protein YgfZ